MAECNVNIDSVLNENMNLGAVYTPDQLASYAADLLVKVQKDIWIKEFNDKYGEGEKVQEHRLKYIQHKLLKWIVLDPACGDGSLLYALENRINEEITNIKDEMKSLDCNIEVAVTSENNTTIAVDIDNKAILKTYKKLNEILSDKIGRNLQAKCVDSLAPFKVKDKKKSWQELFPEIMKTGGFGGIIANPPWGADFYSTTNELRDMGYSLATGQFDSYELFIELCIDIAKAGSPLLFIIPDSIFLEEHERLRKYLLDNTQLYLIARLGEKVFPNICRACSVILLIKNPPNKDSITKCFRLDFKWKEQILLGKKTFCDAQDALSHDVLQERFLENKNYGFDIDIKDEEKRVIDKIEKMPITWDEIFNCGRGVELSKKGIVVLCPECQHWQAPPRGKKTSITCNKCGNSFLINDSNVETIILKNRDADGEWVPLIVGESLKRYSIKRDRFIKLNVKGIQYKDDSEYNKRKIVIRKTGLGIDAAIDNLGNYVTQTVFYYYLKDHIDMKRYPLEYFLGVLNSRIMYYYYIKKYGENEWRSHPYLTQSRISTLPIYDVIADSTKLPVARRIADLVIMNSTDKSISMEADLQIELLVGKLYDLSKNEIVFILEEINKTQDLEAINIMKVSNYSKLLSSY